MKDAKSAVIDFLKNDRSLLGGRNLYNILPGKSLALQKQMARWTDTPTNVERVCHELAKLVGLEERLLKIYTQKPVEKISKMEVVHDVVDSPEPSTPKEKLLAFDPEKANYHESVSLAKELEIKPSGRKKTDVFAALSSARTELIKKQLEELPSEVKDSIRIRDQFPFLRGADCPDSLKILVNDLVNSYERFKENQPKLHDVLDDPEAKALVDEVLKDYIGNKEAWEELEHYKSTGQVLGKHPIFELIQEKEEISAMKTEDLAQKIKAIENNLSRNRNKGNAELVAKYENLLDHAKGVLAKR